MRSLTPILEEGVFTLRFGSIGADVTEEAFSIMGHGGSLNPLGIPMPCSMPASLSPTPAPTPTPVSRRNSGPVGPRQSPTNGSGSGSTTLTAPVVVDDNYDYRPARFQGHRRLDRCLSEPTTTAAATTQTRNSSRNAVGNSSRYKTELCRAFEETGHCKYGEKCQFAHGHQELRTVHRHRKYKTELCRTFHTIGFCPYGPRCHFIHNADEARMKPAVTPRPLSISSSSSTTSSPTHSDSLSGSPTSSFTMFWAPGDEDRLQLDSPPTFHANHQDLDMFVASGINAVKPTRAAPVAVDFPDFIGGAHIGLAPRLPVFSQLAGSDADPADR